MEKKEPNAKKDLPNIFPSELTKIYASGAFGGYTSHDFRLFFYSEEPFRMDELLPPNILEIAREVQGEVILSPLAAKELVKWLDERVKAFEETFGEIPSPPTE